MKSLIGYALCALIAIFGIRAVYSGSALLGRDGFRRIDAIPTVEQTTRSGFVRVISLNPPYEDEVSQAAFEKAKGIDFNFYTNGRETHFAHKLKARSQLFTQVFIMLTSLAIFYRLTPRKPMLRQSRSQGS